MFMHVPGPCFHAVLHRRESEYRRATLDGHCVSGRVGTGPDRMRLILGSAKLGSAYIMR